MSDKILIIPIEILYRDLDSRLLITLEAIKRNYTVLLGEHDFIRNNITEIPRGIYLDKSLAANKEAFFKYIISQGFKLVSTDEECFMSYNNTYRYLNVRHSKNNLDICDYFFASTKYEHNLLCEYYNDFKDKIKLTGNPRVNIWKSKDKQLLFNDELNYINKYNEFILIPTNFGYPHMSGNESFLYNQAKLYGSLNTVGDEYIWKEKRKYKKRNYEAFLELIDFLKHNLNKQKIIVRPHPAENLNHWKRIEDNNKIFVEYKYAVSPWIYRCKAMIHNSCTTGIEGYLNGVRTISYLPYTYNEDVKHISNKLSRIVHNKEETIIALNDRMTNSSVNEETLNEINIAENNYSNIMDHIDNIKLECDFSINLKNLNNVDCKITDKKISGFNVNLIMEKLKTIEKIFNFKLQTLNIRKLHEKLFHIK